MKIVIPTRNASIPIEGKQFTSSDKPVSPSAKGLTKYLPQVVLKEITNA